MSWSIRGGLLVFLALGCSSPSESAPPEADKPAKPAPSAPAAPAEAASPTAPAAAGFDAAMQAVVEPYLVIQDALARDTTEGVEAAAKRLATAAAALPTAPPHAALPAKLTEAATAVGSAADLASARAAFKGLSMAMGAWATQAEPAGLDVVYCSMAKGSWLQKPGAIRNPYHGSEMLACGEVVSGPSKAE